MLAEDEHYIDGKLVECKKAVPKETSSLAAYQPSKDGPITNATSTGTAPK